MKTFSYTLLILLAILNTTPALAGTAILSWDPNTEVDMAGYKVFVGTSSGNYAPTGLNVGNVTQYTLDLQEGQTYYFAVKAYNTSGDESGFSNEVSKLIGTTTGGGGSSPAGGGGGCGMVRNISGGPGQSPGQVALNLTLLAFLLTLPKMKRLLKVRVLNNMETPLCNNLAIEM